MFEKRLRVGFNGGETVARSWRVKELQGLIGTAADVGRLLRSTMTCGLESWANWRVDETKITNISKIIREAFKTTNHPTNTIVKDLSMLQS
jgi:hypothetical protein